MLGFFHHFFLPFFPDFTGPPMLENKPMHFLNHHDAKITYGGKKVEIFVEMSTSAWKKTLVWLQAGKEGCSPCRNASSLMTNGLLEGSLQNKAQAVSFWKQGWLGSRHLVVRALCRNVLRKLQNLSLVCYMLCNSDQQRDDYQPPAIPFQVRAVGTSENPGERVLIQGLLKEVLFLKLKIWWEFSHCSDGPASWYVGLEASEQQPRKGSHAINWLRCQISSRILALLGNIKCADSGMEEPSDIAGRMSAEADEAKGDDETRRNWKIDT